MEEQFIERERENIGKKKKKFSRGIIRLNNVTDLIKIPINDLNSLDVNALKGNLYKKIYEEALKEEKNLIQKRNMNIESEEAKSDMENLGKRNNLSSLYVMEQKKNSSNNVHLRDKKMKINLSSSSSDSEEKNEDRKDFYEIKKTNTIYTSQSNKIINQFNFNFNKSYKGQNLNYNNLNSNSTKKINSDKNNTNYNINSVNRAYNPYANNNASYTNYYSNSYRDKKSFVPINQRQNPQENQIKNINMLNDTNNSSNKHMNISNSNINLRNNLSLINSMIKKIIFNINYTTTFGEEMGILGSLPILGNWDGSKAFKLIWSNGHVWKGEIPVNNYIVKGFEFKFVIIQDKKVKTWENGENNKFDYDGFIKEIKVNKKGFYSKYEYEYNAHNGELSFYCKWRY
jgi:hypothetical protein